MYIVTITNGNFSTEIHGAEEKLKSGKVTKGINAIDSFVFSMLPDNAGFDLIHEFQTHVTVYNTNKNRYDFIGRVLYAETTMSESGLIVKSVTCESLFGYLCDSVQDYVEAQNWTVAGLLQHLIDCHNSQTEGYKHFKVGNITQTETNDNIYIGIQRENTWDAVRKKLIDQIGGELRFRMKDDGLYIDYLEQIGGVRDTPIAVSVNMKSITRAQDPTSYITRLIPLGSKLTDENGKETENRLDITAANNGIKYIEDTEAVEMYGVHVKVVEFDDITTPEVLLARGKQWMAANNRINVKYTVSAIDLSLVGLAVHNFDIGNTHPINNHLLGIEDTARIIKVSLDVCEEHKSSFEVGDNIKSLSDLQLEQKDQSQSTEETIKNLQSETHNQKVELQETITEQVSSVMVAFDSILMSVMESYSQKSAEELEEFKTTLQTEFGVWADGLMARVTATEQSIQEVDGDLQEKFNTITKYFTFDIDGLTIGQVDNPNKVVIDNDEISILVGNQIIQTFKSTGEALIPILKVSSSFNLLGLQVTETDTHINCDFIGGGV